MRNVTTVLFIFLFVAISSAEAVERTLEISDREIVEKLTRLEEGQKHLKDEIKVNREEIQSVRDELNGSIQSVRDELNGSIQSVRDELNGSIQSVRDELNGSIQSVRDDLKGLMLWGFGVTFAGIFALIGFVLWDRRTAIAPVARANRELMEEEMKLKNVLKEYAREEPRLLEILKGFGIL